MINISFSRVEMVNVILSERTTHPIIVILLFCHIAHALTKCSEPIKCIRKYFDTLLLCYCIYKLLYSWQIIKPKVFLLCYDARR